MKVLIMWLAFPLVLGLEVLLIFLLICLEQYIWCKKNKKGFWQTLLWGTKQYEEKEVQEEV